MHSMGYNVAFYVHHHGSGHLMRAISIASKLNRPVTFLGSGMQQYQGIIPEFVTCIHLPMDVADSNDVYEHDGNEVNVLHYAPLNVKGIRERNLLLSHFFVAAFPVVLVVDVSVEIALFARLCGIPTILMRQHGYRNDPAHIAAYQSASLLIAPYSETMQSDSLEWVNRKTVFSGGFSRYSEKEIKETNGDPHQIAILCGKGGTSLSTGFVNHLAVACPMYQFHSIGSIGDESACRQSNVTYHGEIDDPIHVLASCGLIIGNGGHNTVMEAASLNKRFICISEERPFDEQLHKARMLRNVFETPIVTTNELYTTEWQTLIQKTLSKPANWNGMIDKNALGKIALAIEGLGQELLHHT